MPRWTLSVALALCAALPAAVSAQAPGCSAPADLPTPRAAGPSQAEPVRDLPVGAYTLALGWSPQYCRDHADETSFQCGGTAHFGFMLHGLWPDGKGADWPQYCKPADILPATVLRQQLCSTPSVDLIQHEWAKHGTCSAQAPAAYFADGRRLFAMIRFPDMAALSRDRTLTVAGFAKAFAAANRTVPGLTASAVRVRVARDLWLSEVWLCMDRTRKFAACGPGQAGGYAGAQRLRIWRGD